MIDPFDLRPGSRIHAPEVFSRKAVQGPPTRDGVRPVYVTKAVSDKLLKERCLRHRRDEWLVRIGQTTRALPLMLGVPSGLPIRTVVVDGVTMMPVRDFDVEPLWRIIDAMRSSAGFRPSFRKVGLVAGRCSSPVLHLAFPVRDLIAFLASRAEADRLKPLTDWLVGSFPSEAEAARFHRPTVRDGSAFDAAFDFVEARGVVEAQGVVDIERGVVADDRSLVRVDTAEVPSTEPTAWADAVPVAWSIVGGRAVLDRPDLARHLAHLGFDATLLRVFGIDGSDGTVDAEALGDAMRLPAVVGLFERAPAFRAWLVLVRIAASRAAIDKMMAEVAAHLAVLDPDRPPRPHDNAVDDAVVEADADMVVPASRSVH